jgi:hypothetical protein
MEFTRPATWDDVKTLATYLTQAGVDYALVGGYAIAAHGFNRFSEDIDILVEPSAENARRWIAALSRLPDHAARELADEPDVFAHDKRYAIRINDEFTVDVMPSIAGAMSTPPMPRNASPRGRQLKKAPRLQPVAATAIPTVLSGLSRIGFAISAPQVVIS